MLLNKFKIAATLTLIIFTFVSTVFLRPVYGQGSGQSQDCRQGGSGTIDTAIGCINVANLQNFTEFFVGWFIGIGGGVALVLIIYAGFLISTSAGNPKQVAAGKELLTAAVSGLVLLIMSAYILQLIGVDILDIFEGGNATGGTSGGENGPPGGVGGSVEPNP